MPSSQRLLLQLFVHSEHRLRFWEREEAQKRLSLLQELRSECDSLYPFYLEEILEERYFHLYDHLIKMKQLATLAEREAEEKDLSFSTFSHVILEFKKIALAKAEKLIPEGRQTLFILGDHRLKQLPALPTFSKYYHLDPYDKELIDILVKNKLIYQITSREDKSFSFSMQNGSRLEKIKLFEKSILETSLINTLLCESYPEIGKFFHLEEMDPTIVKNYDKQLIEMCIRDYIDEVVTDFLINQEMINKIKNQLSEEQNKVIGYELSRIRIMF
ncbi:MAG: hypothetical protein QRY72_01050 [Candidatus Rhabdochlamydia sp.]